VLHIPQQHSDHSVGHLGPYSWTVWTMGLYSLVLRSEVSFGADMSGHFGRYEQCRSISVPNYLGSEVSGYAYLS